MRYNLRGFDALGDIAPSLPAPRTLLQTGKSAAFFLVPVATGALGSILWRSHPLLGFLGGLAIGQAGKSLYRGDPTAKAVVQLGITGTAIAGSLLWRRHPVLGHLGGALIGSAGGTYLLGRLGQ